MKSLCPVTGDDYAELYQWMANLHLGDVVKSTYAPNRRERFFRLGSNLKNPRTTGRVIEYEEPPIFVVGLGNLYLPGWHSALVCGGDTTIDWHRDHPHFEAIAVMINLGEAEYTEQEAVAKPLEWTHLLTDGDVVEIDTKLMHKAKPLTDFRMNLTFRKIKEEYLPLRFRPLFKEN